MKHLKHILYFGGNSVGLLAMKGSGIEMKTDLYFIIQIFHELLEGFLFQRTSLSFTLNKTCCEYMSFYIIVLKICE